MINTSYFNVKIEEVFSVANVKFRTEWDGIYRLVPLPANNTMSTLQFTDNTLIGYKSGESGLDSARLLKIRKRHLSLEQTLIIGKVQASIMG